MSSVQTPDPGGPAFVFGCGSINSCLLPGRYPDLVCQDENPFHARQGAQHLGNAKGQPLRPYSRPWRTSVQSKHDSPAMTSSANLARILHTRSTVCASKNGSPRHLCRDRNHFDAVPTSVGTSCQPPSVAGVGSRQENLSKP